jgi:hypothetical protein
VRRRWLLSIFALALALGAARADAGGDQRELKAREDFAAGRYQQALDAFAKLYAETLHPTYLRNIGRCYQNLGEPDRAITSFRDYLRKAKGISSDERKEVEGFISEMEELKRQKEASASSSSSSGATTTTAPPPVMPLPTETTKTPGPTANASVVLTAPPPPPPPAESPPVYERWWFWAIIGGAIAGGLGAAAAAGVFTKTKDASCTMPGFGC